jgi:hypothetical protein
MHPDPEEEQDPGGGDERPRAHEEARAVAIGQPAEPP